MSATIAVVCGGPKYRRCTNIVIAENAFLGPIERTGGKGPVTMDRLIGGAVCDRCANHLKRKGFEMRPLVDALKKLEAAQAAADRAEQEKIAAQSVSLGELLLTSSTLNNSRRVAAARARDERNECRRQSAEQATRFIAAAQRLPVAA